jgi:hypothetical protein
VTINFTHAFSRAWDRMVVICFQPFHAGKWFTIGFSAFLAGLLAGGNGVSWLFGNNNNNNSNNNRTALLTPHIPSAHHFYHVNGTVQTTVLAPSTYYYIPTLPNIPELSTSTSNYLAGLQAGVAILIVGVFAGIVLVLFLLAYWLGSRGQFLFLDNIVRNRGAISWPWHTYARQGNSLFFFLLLCILILLVVLVPFTVVGVLVSIPLFQQHGPPSGSAIAVFLVMCLVYMAILLVLSIVFFLFRELGPALMFRQGITARVAFGETLGLIRRFPGSIAMLIVLRIALFVALAVLSLIVCCLSCCLGGLPYLGSVLLLPALIYIKAFTLDCLAQFGPNYDVWTVDVSPLDPG